LKRIVKVIVFVTILAALARLSVEVESVQKFILAGVAGAFVQNALEPAAESSGNLRVFVCGSASPLGRTDRAQACIAVVTPEHFFLIDSGAGSTDNLGAGRLPMVRLDGLLLTHFHSDHIAEL
jgi:ribonuclease Z